VIEMGMNHRGEIEFLSALASPDVSIITNIGRAHVGLLGSLGEVALAKLEIVRGMERGGTLIVPSGEPLLDVHPDGIRIRTFGRRRSDDVAVESGRPEGLGRLLLALVGFPPVHLHAAGDGNALNAAAAAAAGLVLGLSRAEIAAGLERFEPPPGRLAFRERSGITFIEDHYNANPDSFRVALEVLLGSRVRGRRIAVIGEMLEQGSQAAAAHEEVGRAAAAADAVLSVGEHAASVIAGVSSSRRGHPASLACGDNTEAAGALGALARAGDIVLVKGSRGARLEEILAAFPEG
jgi:UDP-N-acetylmuramoyl-tripeptide--D-alanyl-D-alanine ligase